MHRKWKEQGLVVVTVNVNTDTDVTPEENAKTAREFLLDKKVTVLNLVLDESLEFVKDKLRIAGGYPAAYLFDRQGRWTAFGGDFDQLVEHKTIDALIEKMLAEK